MSVGAMPRCSAQPAHVSEQPVLPCHRAIQSPVFISPACIHLRGAIAWSPVFQSEFPFATSSAASRLRWNSTSRSRPTGPLGKIKTAPRARTHAAVPGGWATCALRARAIGLTPDPIPDRSTCEPVAEGRSYEPRCAAAVRAHGGADHRAPADGIRAAIASRRRVPSRSPSFSQAGSVAHAYRQPRVPSPRNGPNIADTCRGPCRCRCRGLPPRRSIA